MSWEIHQILIGIHIFLAITWVGGILFVGWGVYPAAKALGIANQRLFLLSMMRRTHWLFTLAGAGVITTGILLGTVAGPIRTWSDVRNTSFGHIWFTALCIGLFTLSWGIFVGYKQTMKVLGDDSLWKRAETTHYLKPINDAMKKTAALESVEILGFITIIICMLYI